jgi:hypothetical protein
LYIAAFDEKQDKDVGAILNIVAFTFIQFLLCNGILDI